MTGERWACARCGMKNVGTVGSCASCGLLRGSVVVSSPPAGEVKGGAPPADTRGLPDSLPDFPVELTGPYQVFLYTRARLRERGGRAARRAILATAVGSPLVVGMLAWAMATEQEPLFLPIGLLGPLLLGVVAGIAIPGVAGWVFAIIGSALGGIVVGVGLWLGVASGRLDLGSDGPVGPFEALVYVALMALLVPVLMGAQFGVGVVIGSALAAIRARRV
jgi:hypothetical protein